MELDTLKQLEVPFGQGGHRLLVVWPIVGMTDNAWKIRTPGGEIWVPKWRWQGPGLYGDKMRLQLVLALFEDISRTHHDARIPVKKVGKGSSEKSVQVSFLIQRIDKRLREDDQETVKRSATVPLSLLEQGDGGAWSMPHWAIAQKLNKEKEKLASKAVWPGLAAVQAQLQSAFDASENFRNSLEQMAQAAAQASRLAQEQRRASRDQINAGLMAARLALIAEDGEFALSFAKKRLTLAGIGELGQSLADWPQWRPGQALSGQLALDLQGLVEAVRRHPDFKPWREKNAHRAGLLLKAPKPAKPTAPRQPQCIMENATVHWPIWNDKSMQRDWQCAHGCTVRVFGQKHEITLSDGWVFIKMAGPNLKIIQSGSSNADS